MDASKQKTFKTPCLITRFYGILIVQTELSERAFHAFGFSCCTYIPSVKNEPVVGPGYDFFGDVFNQLFFSLQWIFCIAGEPDPFRDPEDVRVNSHGRLVIYRRSDHIG